jgi:AraC family transcriptional regulator of adaptative response / methylphosphotriester-DNA alkyltransferase methyltransferase
MDDRRIDDIKRWIIEHLASVCHIEDVAQEFRVNPETLHKRFRRVEGVSVGRFISRRRLEQAMDLARHSGLLEKEIAEKTGLRTSVNLARLFKRASGMTFSNCRSRYRSPTW